MEPVQQPHAPWKFETTACSTPSTPGPLKLDMLNLSPVEFPPNPHSLHRLPTPDPSRTRTYSSLGSDASSVVLSPEDTSVAGTGSETVQNSPTTRRTGLHLSTHHHLAPPTTRLSPLPSPTESNRRLGSPPRGIGSPPGALSPTASESGGSPRSTTSKTSAFFGSGFAAGPTPAPPAPLVKSKSISRLHASRSNTSRDDPSSFAFNAGVGGANVNRSASDSRPRRSGTANDSFFSQSAATLTPAPPPSLSRRPSTKNRPGTPDSAISAQVTSPDRTRLPPRERFFPSRGNVDRRDQWEEAAAGYGYGSPPGPGFASSSSLNGFGSTTSLNGLGGWENSRRWGGSQASTGWSGGSSRGVSPARPETRAFVDLDEINGGGEERLGRSSFEQHAETDEVAKDKPTLPTLTTLLANATTSESTPRPIAASLPTPISLTPTKKPVRSAHAGSGLSRHPHPHGQHSHLHREHSHLHPSNPTVPRPPSPKADDHLCDSDVKLRLIRPLGVGAFSCVWLAEDEQGSLAAGGDRRAHSTSEAKRRRDRRMHGLRPSATGTGTGTGTGARDWINGNGEAKPVEVNGSEKAKTEDSGGDLARGRDISRGQSPFLVEPSPVAAAEVPVSSGGGAPGRLVAVKMMDRALCDVNDRTRISFVREVEVLRHISHPSIVAYLHSFTTPTHHCLVVEHIGGGELFDLINMEENRNKMTEPLLRRLWGELCRAVGWMHSVALVHRDIKLENILLTSNPFSNPVPPLTTPLLKLTDFGLSRFIDPAHPMLTTRCGSEEYAAPEIIMGSSYDGRETDAWACGVVLFALGTGVLPFADPPAASPAPSNHSSYSPQGPQRRSYLLRIAQCQYDPSELSEGARRIVGRLLVRTPAKRAKVAELWSDPWMRGAGAPPPPPGLALANGIGEKEEHDAHEAAEGAFLVDKEGIDSVARQEIPISSE